MLRNPDALEDLMAKHLADVLRDVFGSKWSRMCQNLRSLTSEAPTLRVDLPAVAAPTDTGIAAPPAQPVAATVPSAEVGDASMGVASPTVARSDGRGH